VLSSQGCGLDGSSVEVEAGSFDRGQGRGQGRIEAGLLALHQQPTSFHFRSFISSSSSAEDRVLK